MYPNNSAHCGICQFESELLIIYGIYPPVGYFDFGSMVFRAINSCDI
jgi:hypothetical protein